VGIGNKKILAALYPSFLERCSKVARVESTKEMLRILQESETGILLASQQAMSLGFNA
jgi:hypothetical protein